MAFMAGLFTFLSSYPALAELVSTRIYPLLLPPPPDPEIMPQPEYLPALVYNKISGPRVYSHSGDSGLENPRYQIDCWSEDPDTAEQVAGILIEALSGYAGPMGNETVGASFIENDEDGYDPETGLYRVMVEVLFWKEA